MFNNFSAKAAPGLIAVSALISCTSQTSPTPAVLDTVIQNADAIVQPWASDAAPGVAVAVSLNDEIVFARGAGLANLEHNILIRPDSVFQVASVSKQFTAFATLLLVSDGVIDLNADIRTYIPELHAPPKTITVQHLLDHMGGLRERNTLAAMAGWMADDIQTHAQLTDLIVRQRGVNFHAGDEVEYSNTGYALLAEIVSRTSGQSFQSFMSERVFEPLNMKNTRFPESRNDLIPGRATSYFSSGESFKTIVAASETFGSTGLYTTALDLLKWAENFETRIIGNDRVFALMAERSSALNGDVSTFAKGQEFRRHNGLDTWSHGGRDAGYRSFVLRVPEEDLELSILSNRTDFDTAKMAFTLVDTFLEGSEAYQYTAPASFDPATPDQLAAYAGDYEFYPGVIFSLRATAEGLTFAQLNAARDALEPLPQIGARRFELNSQAGLSIDFATPQTGQSAGFDYQISLHGKLPAKRIELEPYDADSANLEDYIGTFESAELAAKVTLTSKNGVLYAKQARLPIFELTPFQTDTFYSPDGPLQKVEFVRGDNGRIEGFSASAALSENVSFTRVRDR